MATVPKAVDDEQGNNIVRTCHSRQFLITEQGSLGLGPMTVEVGDLVCILLGSNLPFILRKQGNGEYHLVGESYARGLMDGEAMQGKGDNRFQMFILI